MAWELSPLFCRYRRPFSRLSEGERTAYLQASLDSRFGPRRLLALWLKNLCLMAFCNDPRVGEAIGLALSIFNSRKSGIRWETLFRDETAGALDPENAQRYVSMLRRALSLGGYRQVIYVAHLPAVWEAADVQLHVEDGRIRIGGQDEVAA